MTPEIKEAYEELKMITDTVAGFLVMVDDGFLSNFEEKARPFANGTMAPIAAHYMSLMDLQKTEENLTHAIEVSKTLRKLRGLLIRDEKEGE